MQEIWVWSLGWEDPLEKGKAGVFSTPVFWPGEFPGSVDHGVTKTWTQLSDFHFTSPWLDLVWEIQISFGIQWCLSLRLPRWLPCHCRRHKRYRFDPWAWKILWRRKWYPTPVFLPGEFLGVTKSWTWLSNFHISLSQAPQSLGFSRQEYWSELPFPSPWDLPNPELKSIPPPSPASPRELLTTVPPRKPFN